MHLRVITACTCLSASFLLMGLQCRNYFASLPFVNYSDLVSVSPLQKTYQVGDTIWFTYNNPGHRFTRIDNGDKTTLDSLSFPVTIRVNASYNSPLDSTGGYVEYVTPFGVNAGLNVSGFESASSLNYGCNTGGSYAFRTGVALKKKGLYLIEITGGAFAACPDRVTPINNAGVTFKLDAEDLNLDVYQAAIDSTGATDTYYNTLIPDRQGMAALVK